MTSMHPVAAARCSGVLPRLVFASTFAPWWSSSCTEDDDKQTSSHIEAHFHAVYISFQCCHMKRYCCRRENILVASIALERQLHCQFPQAHLRRSTSPFSLSVSKAAVLETMSPVVFCSADNWAPLRNDKLDRGVQWFNRRYHCCRMSCEERAENKTRRRAQRSSCHREVKRPCVRKNKERFARTELQCWKQDTDEDE